MLWYFLQFFRKICPLRENHFWVFLNDILATLEFLGKIFEHDLLYIYYYIL